MIYVLCRKIDFVENLRVFGVKIWTGISIRVKNLTFSMSGNVKFCGLYSVSFFILCILHFSCPTKVSFLDPGKNLRGLPFYILQHPNLLIYSTQTVYKAVAEIHNTWNTLALNSNTKIIQTLNTNNTTHNANVQRAG